MAPMDPLEISGYTDIQLFARGRDFFAYYRAKAFDSKNIPILITLTLLTATDHKLNERLEYTNSNSCKNPPLRKASPKPSLLSRSDSNSP